MIGFHVFLIVALDTTRKVGLNPNCMSGSSPSDSDSSSLSPRLLSSSDNTRRRRSSVLFPLENDDPATAALDDDDDDNDPGACGRELLELLLLLRDSGRDFEELDDEEGRFREFEPLSLSLALEPLVELLVDDDLVDVFWTFFLLPPELVVLLPFANETDPFGTFAIVVSCRRAAVFSSLVPEGSRVCMCLCVVS